MSGQDLGCSDRLLPEAAVFRADVTRHLTGVAAGGVAARVLAARKALAALPAPAPHPVLVGGVVVEAAVPDAQALGGSALLEPRGRNVGVHVHPLGPELSVLPSEPGQFSKPKRLMSIC